MPNLSEEQRLEQRIIKKFQKALVNYRLIDDGDKILVGISGGKDSICMLEMFSRRVKIHRPSFTVEAVHVRMNNIKYESDTSYLENFANSHGIKLHVINTEYDNTQDTKKPPCFLCSWHRRKVLFNYAQEHKFNKIALGHHMDDIIHTALMNQFFQGHFSTMPVKLTMKKMPITIIRPLAMVEERDIMKYAIIKQYQKQLKTCPFEDDTQRNNVRNIFNDIELMNPEARYSIWNALETEGKLIE